MIIRRLLFSTRALDKFGKIRKDFVRRNSSQAPAKILECLKNKSVLRVSGKDSSEFLQGLITNDMKHLEEGAANLYSLFLNIKGRVMYDAIVYKSQEDSVFYVECDSQAAEPLQKHLKMYRVRRKIDIESLEDKINVWSLFDPSQYSRTGLVDDESGKSKLEGLIFPCGTLNNKASKVVDNIMIYEDPRLQDLGFRILVQSDFNKNEIMKYLNSHVSNSDNDTSYRAFRYKLGIAEGMEDLPPGKPFPLEINCDYLHGVSFHKGCYIGQELTARTYHTGVVRKRLMPLLFDEVPTKSFSYDDKIIDQDGNAVGKFRGNEKQYALGLMRITEALNAQNLSISGTSVKVLKPNWWPQDTQTETASINRKQ